MAWQARTLLRDARSATLATVQGGQPFAALVTPACAPDLSVLMLLSSLSEHTRQLLAEPSCAIMVVGQAVETNLQTAPRLTIVGKAVPIMDQALHERWVARHPYAAFYAGFGDFSLFRLRPESAHFVGGFAKAWRLEQADLIPDPHAVRMIADAEPSLIAEINANHMAAVTRIAGSPNWRVSAIDVDGCDLVREQTVQRIAWTAPVRDTAGVIAELAGLPVSLG